MKSGRSNVTTQWGRGSARPHRPAPGGALGLSAELSPLKVSRKRESRQPGCFHGGNLCSMKAGGSWPEHRALLLIETSCPASNYMARGGKTIFSFPVFGGAKPARVEVVGELRHSESPGCSPSGGRGRGAREPQVGKRLF